MSDSLLLLDRSQKRRSFSKLERGLVIAIDHSKITSSSTNKSPSKAAWSMTKERRFSWQVNPIHKRITHLDSYMNSSFNSPKRTGDSTFGATKRDPFPGTSNPSPAEYEIGSTFKRSSSCRTLSKVNSVRALSHHYKGETSRM